MRITLEKIVNGGQTLGLAEDGRKAFVWGGLPVETVDIRVTKKKARHIEGVAERIITPPSEHRIAPRDPESYLSTSPWQILSFEQEQLHKARLIREAFELHHVELPGEISVYTDGVEYGYRNKVEFSWYGDSDAASGVETLDLAFFRRGSKGKIVVDDTSLARPEITELARKIRDLLRTKPISARNLKTLLIRCDQAGKCVWQLYVKDKLPELITENEARKLPAQGGEIIYSNPKSPASVITKRLATFGAITLADTILDVPFRYATEGFFQVNVPVYEQALRDMREWIELEKPVLDLYAGVGSIGLTIGGDHLTLVELNEHAVREMRENIARLNRNAEAVLAASERALDYITPDEIVIVDPPRAGLHADVVARLLEQLPPRIIYLSCNPVTQARDTALLLEKYAIRDVRGYNFFPRTPHIESLVVLDLI